MTAAPKADPHCLIGAYCPFPPVRTTSGQACTSLDYRKKCYLFLPVSHPAGGGDILGDLSQGLSRLHCHVPQGSCLTKESQAGDINVRFEVMSESQALTITTVNPDWFL